MSKRKTIAAVWCIGSFGYGLLEIIWRGYTHWSMLLTGGVCLRFVYALNSHMRRASWLVRCFTSSCAITGCEFFAGCIFNKALHMNVWDYSGRFGNIWGQICPLYSLLWFFLCFPLVLLCRVLRFHCIEEPQITAGCDKKRRS